jgi:hypothetical protein
LRALPDDAWDRQAIAGAWTVRDVAAHLLDGDLRKLSAVRDNHHVLPDRPLNHYADVVGFLNRLNASGVAAARRLSPRVLIDLLEISGHWVADLVASLPPHAPALHAVAWAGERQSEQWMDTGREFTERWHHQMQIREAVGAPGLYERRFFFPLMEFSVRALPNAYARTIAPDGTAIQLDVHGPEVLTWTLRRDDGLWRLHRGAAPAPIVTVRFAAEDAWRLFYNSLPLAEAQERARIDGDAPMATPLFSARSVMV